MNTLVYTKGIARYSINGESISQHVKPFLSFNYDELYFTKEQKLFVLNKRKFILNNNIIAEINSFINNFAITYPKSLLKEKNQDIIYTMKNYLTSTDWMVIRELETGKKMPQDIKEERIRARNKINELKKG